jgi:REP element-mobilizing transposase RayT
MSASPVLLTEVQRHKIETVCKEHAAIREWVLHAVNARSNHVQLALTADQAPEVVRDQLKANATRALRQNPDAMTVERIWTRGGDCEILDTDEELERVVQYITEAQDRMDRGK